MIILETIPQLQNIIDPDVYVIYPTGGYHFFSKAKNAPQHYREPIWPHVKKIKALRKHSKNGIITPGVNHTKNWYPTLNLERYVLNKRKTKKQSMHSLVALAFIPNKNPSINVIIHHRNNDKCDYRIENLEWTTIKKNSIGNPMHLRRTPNQIYNLYRQTLSYEI